MKINEKMCSAEGFVSPSFIDLSTGRRMPFGTRKNMLSYMSAEAMAAAFGGDPSYIPARVGFIYGDMDTMPSQSEVITRDQDWNSLLEQLAASSENATLDVQVVNFSYSPTLGGGKSAPEASESGSGSSSSPSSSPGSDSGSDSGSGQSDQSDGDYCHILPTGSNAITFHAVSNHSDAGVRGTAPFSTSDYIYQAVLLGYHSGDYYVISRVSQKVDGQYLQKPDGFEVALDWTIVFR